MGNSLRSPTEARQHNDDKPDENASKGPTTSRKRNRISDVEDDFEGVLRTPKKRKLRTTSRYIYETLYVDSKDSDITLIALEREWKLHKLYLCQSPYFSSMFSGSWRESTMSEIAITIVDPNITVEALNTTLGSLYQDELTVEPAEVIPILACANLFQLDGLMDQCIAIMEESTNVRTVVRYYDTSLLYGVDRVRESCLKWLKINMMHHMPEQIDRLKEITPELMSLLIGSPELFVMQTEFSVYVLLRLWLFLVFHPNWTGNPQEAVLMSHKFFQEKAKNSKPFFLESDDGHAYIEVFKRLRLNHLVNHHMDMDILISDRIIPQSWMYPIYQMQWHSILKIDQGIDKGPQVMTDDEFNQNCLRCGRTLNTAGQQHMWRWTGFNMGVDLIVTFSNWNLTLKRSLSSACSNDHEALLDNHKKRKIYYRITVVSINDQKQVVYEETTGIQSANLGRNSTHPLLKLDPTRAAFPLLLSFNFAVSTPVATEATGRQVNEPQVDVENVPA